MRAFAVTLLTLVLAVAVSAQQPNTTSQDSTQPPAAATQAPVTAPPADSSPAAASGDAAPQSQAGSASQESQKSESSSSELPIAKPGTSIVLPDTDPRELKEAARLFKAGVKLKDKGKLDEAFKKFERASELAPRNVSYLTARELARQELVMDALKKGNRAMLDNKEIDAMADFRKALEYDPTNDYALQRLRDSMPDDSALSSHTMRAWEQSTPIELQPSDAHHDFSFRGNVQTLLTQVAQAYGITAIFDSSVQQKRVRFEIQDVNFATAMEAATAVTKTFWTPLSSKQIMFAADTTENRRTFSRMTLRTFYLPDVQNDRELTEMSNSLRVLFNLRFITVDKAASTISVRGEGPAVEAVSRVLESLTSGRPEVMLDVRVYEIGYSFLRQIGTTPPSQFTMFNISPALIASLGANAQNLINQLIASGGINSANSQSISALLAQLQNSSQNSLLSTPFATFGGGLTTFGVSGGTGATFTLSLNTSDIRSLDHVLMRASQNDAATMKLGQRYPIVNATFAPIYNTSAIASVIGNQSYIAPFPSFQFEDLGLSLKATPVIHADRDVSLKLEMQVRSLGSQNVNGIPIINNREYSGYITLKNGESGVVAGLVTKDDIRSMAGLPFLAKVPALTYAAAQSTKNVTEDELMVVITPHILRMQEDRPFAIEMPAGH